MSEKDTNRSDKTFITPQELKKLYKEFDLSDESVVKSIIGDIHLQFKLKDVREFLEEMEKKQND